MAELVVEVSEEAKKRMTEFSEVDWSEILERAIFENFRKLSVIKIFDELFKESELTDADCLRLGKQVNRAVRLKIEKELSSEQQ